MISSRLENLRHLDVTSGTCRACFTTGATAIARRRIAAAGGKRMCGIAGWAFPSHTSHSSALLRRMTDAIAHRGPDGEGEFLTQTVDGRYDVALGHRRLAIIDLVGGLQPMHDCGRRLTIIYNGEIYNFRELRRELEGAGQRFVTNSDTEVLLAAYAAWGEECLPRLRGMFAFAIWDAEREALFLARDKFGKKPLYMLDTGNGVAFASEVKSLLQMPGVEPAFDRQALVDYLAYRYVPAPLTFFRGIRKLLPGSYAIWQNGHLAEKRYFLPPDGAVRPDRHQPADAPQVFLAALDEAVRIRLVSDVPFGAFLSGGLDSSAVVALMSRNCTKPVNTFSVGFAEAAYSELPYARMIAERFGTAHHELVVSAEQIMDHLPALIRFRDAPVSEASDIPIYLLSREAANSVKMILTGEGSDEILAGYPKHLFEPLVSLYQNVVPAWLHRSAVDAIVQRLPYGARRLKILSATLNVRSPQERMPRWFGAATKSEVFDLLQHSPGSPAADISAPLTPGAGQSALRKVLYFDQTSWLPDNLLERGDRMTMAASIEARMPFMDDGLAQTMARLKDRHRTRFGVQKRVLRQAFHDILPREVLNRPKVGFRVPINEWFRGRMKDYVFDHLGGGSFTRRLYRPAVLDKILHEHMTGRSNHERLLWTLISLELFQREYRLSS
jgi:asparagine synthase (glutamine-hydrolysing)